MIFILKPFQLCFFNFIFKNCKTYQKIKRKRTLTSWSENGEPHEKNKESWKEWRCHGSTLWKAKIKTLYGWHTTKVKFLKDLKKMQNLVRLHYLFQYSSFRTLLKFLFGSAGWTLNLNSWMKMSVMVCDFFCILIPYVNKIHQFDYLFQYSLWTSLLKLLWGSWAWIVEWKCLS